jgi:hypothetical protein
LEYDSTVAAARPRDAIAQKRRIVEVVSELEAAFGRVHTKMIETKELFERQIQKAQPGSSNDD